MNSQPITPIKITAALLLFALAATTTYTTLKTIDHRRSKDHHTTPTPPTDPIYPPHINNDPGRCETALAELLPISNPKHQILRAIMFAESRHYYGNKVQPNPYALNIEGKGYHPRSREEALRIIAKAEKRGAKNIDRGCMQINHQYHPNAFASHRQSLDPKHNILYAALFFEDLEDKPLCFSGEARRMFTLPRSKVPHSLRPWYDRMHTSRLSRSIACYHNNASPAKQTRYLNIISEIQRGL